MILHYLKFAQRSLAKYKYYTLINVFGLVTGMLSVLVIAKYIGGSLQFDSFHEKKERIYSISQEEFIQGTSQGNRKSTYLGVADLISQYGEVSHFSTYYQRVESLVIADAALASEQKSFVENKIFVADSAFFRIFTFPFVYGNELTAFSAPSAIVITRSMASKYFGDTNPVGKTMTLRVSWGEEITYQITGVIEDTPRLSRFDFDFLIKQSRLDETLYWDVADYSVFLLQDENNEPGQLTKKLNDALSHVPNLKSENRKINITLDSLASPELSTAEYILVIVGILIMLISWMNYINQVIAQSYWRIKEVGIQRVMGASGGNLKAQFIVESALMCVACLILVCAIYLGLEQPLQSLTNGHLLPLIGDPTYINTAFIGVFAIGVMTAATIQTLVLLPKNFGAGIQNVYAAKIGSMGVRKMLVVVQFSISTILIVSIFVVSGQLDYMRSSDKGFNMEDVLVIKAPMAKRDSTWSVRRENLKHFKERCAGLPFVTGITSSASVPGESYRHETYLRLKDAGTKALIHQNGVDEYFFSLYEMKFIAGQGFIPDARAKNRSGIILNRSAAHALGISDFDKVINTEIVDYEEGQEEIFNLIGIVEDFHQTSMKNEVRPIAFKYNVSRGHCSVKVNVAALKGAGLSNGLGAIHEIWNESYSTVPFEYFFLNDSFNAQDQEDEYFGFLFRYFTILSVIISCMGLFALSLLISTKRQKEVGVRKVFGASSADILRSFLKSYLAPLLISILIGTPVAIAIMEAWLSNYAYRIDIGFDLVALAIGSLVIIFLVTVSYSTVKSSVTNPIKVLKE